MNNKRNYASLFATLLVCTACICATLHFARPYIERYIKPADIVTDTVYVAHTYVSYPEEAKDSSFVRYVFVPVTLRDTLSVHDSALVYLTPGRDSVAIPITQKVYADSTYTAYVSGYRPTLDSLRINMRERIVTATAVAKRKHWGVGVTAGYAITPKGFHPYVGLGINYNIATW